MIKRYKEVMVLALSVALLIPTTVYGKSLTESIKVTYNNIKLSIDGNSITPKDAKGNKVEPFIYNGTTYLPVRAVAEAMGKEVLWDEFDNTVIIGEPGTISIPKHELPTNTSGHDVTNPVPVGTWQKVHVKNNVYEYDANINISLMARGEIANKKVAQAYSWNPKPDDGYEYAIISVLMKVDNASCFAENVDDKKTISTSFWAFKGIGLDGKYIETPSIEIPPEPQFNSTARSGDTIEGLAVIQVRKGEKGMVVFGGPVGNQSGGTVFSFEK